MFVREAIGGVKMNKTRNRNALQRFNRRGTLDPLTRTRLIWSGRVWLVSVLQFVGTVIESFVKIIMKIVLVILAAIFFM